MRHRVLPSLVLIFLFTAVNQSQADITLHEQRTRPQSPALFPAYNPEFNSRNSSNIPNNRARKTDIPVFKHAIVCSDMHEITVDTIAHDLTSINAGKAIPVYQMYTQHLEKPLLLIIVPYKTPTKRFIDCFNSLESISSQIKKDNAALQAVLGTRHDFLPKEIKGMPMGKTFQSSSVRPYGENYAIFLAYDAQFDKNKNPDLRCKVMKIIANLLNQKNHCEKMSPH